MTLRSTCRLACFLSLLSASSVLAPDPPATLYHCPATVISTNLCPAEGNGGVGGYNISDPLNLVLRYSHGERKEHT